MARDAFDFSTIVRIYAWCVPRPRLDTPTARAIQGGLHKKQQKLNFD
jgi:hypothetical protein